VLVNATGDILYISGRTGKYLEPAAGKANWNIYPMAREGLRHELMITLPKALRDREPVTRPGIRVDTDGGPRSIDLTVHPVDEPQALRGMAMIVFSDVPAAPPAPAPAAGTGRSGSKRVTELELALKRAHEELQAAREQMQTREEELRSTTEEFQSTNEELQSTNEELTTSKEEMQSLNEELQTLNAELQSKVDELSLASNDMKNLLNSIDVAIVFLDNALHVRRFTTQLTRMFKLIPGDVGRPLSDIATDLDYPALQDDAREVLRTLVLSDKEIPTRDGRWFHVKTMPYRTADNVIDGVVMTFTDISGAKKLEAVLRADTEDGEPAG
jgi:two-component system CheB/CheR fusion protein